MEEILKLLSKINLIMNKTIKLQIDALNDQLENNKEINNKEENKKEEENKE
jgi:hypothetical protein